jgi:N-ethylmaleimide reductase
MYEALLAPFTLGKIHLKNKVVMAPMTRNRSPHNIPTESVAKYYSQRASAGLIITEGTSPSPNGLGYARIPGIFNDEQKTAWSKVTKKVHENGGKIFIQLMHTGRVSHPSNMPPNSIILAPSPIALTGKMFTDDNGLQDHPIPNEMNEKQIKDTIEEYGKAAELAIDAGFDGIEIHGANGYLVDQFLNTSSNKRIDSWGGTIENRIRFCLEVVKTISGKIGCDRVGIRVSPYGVFNDMAIDNKIEETFEILSSELNKSKILYMHIVDHSSMGAPEVKPSIKIKIRKEFKQSLIFSGGYDARRAESDIVEKKCDLVAFARPFIANPSFVEKIKINQNIIAPDPNTFYTPGDTGYIDYI